MDEVDGMAGNEDRGGVAELIQLIKSSKIPVICMCNDRNHPKIRSLANHCFDLRFQRPRIEQIRVSWEFVSVTIPSLMRPFNLDFLYLLNNDKGSRILKLFCCIVIKHCNQNWVFILSIITCVEFKLSSCFPGRHDVHLLQGEVENISGRSQRVDQRM